MPSSEEQVIGNLIGGPHVDPGIPAITDATDFVSDVLLAEYKTLRDEILKKMDHRTSLVVCSVTVSSAVLGFGIERQSGSLLLVSPLVSLLLGILIFFHNTQIGETSEYIRERIEGPISKRYPGLVGWHEEHGYPKNRLKQRMLPYHLPLILIAVAPAVVAIPLALSNIGSLALAIPVLIVDVSLLVIYILQLIKNHDKI
jgi:hypothetical protein